MCCFDRGFSLLWRVKVWVEVGWPQLEGRTKCVALMPGLVCNGAGKSGLKLVGLPMRDEHTKMP